MGQIPSNSVRHQWTNEISPICPWCLTVEETPLHLMWDCPHAQAAWTWGSKILRTWPDVPNEPINRNEAIWTIQSKDQPSSFTRTVVIAAIGLHIWRTRWTAPEEGPVNEPMANNLLTAELTHQLSIFDSASQTRKAKWRLVPHCPLQDHTGTWRSTLDATHQINSQCTQPITPSRRSNAVGGGRNGVYTTQ